MGAENAHYLDVMIAQWIAVVRSSLFASFFVLKQSSHPHVTVAVLAIAFKLSQLLAFPLRAAWWQPNDGIQLLTNILSPAVLLEGTSATTYASVLGVTATWVLTFAILLAISMAGFATNKTPSIAVLSVLRFGELGCLDKTHSTVLCCTIETCEFLRTKLYAVCQQVQSFSPHSLLCCSRHLFCHGSIHSSGPNLVDSLEVRH